MHTYRPLRAALLAYELLRLAAVLAVAQTAGLGTLVTALTAANALFTLMAFFMLYSLERYGAYAPLYLAGKLIFVCSLAVRLFGSLTVPAGDAAALIRAEAGGNSQSYMIMACLLLMSCDLLSAAGSLALDLKIRANGEQ